MIEAVSTVVVVVPSPAAIDYSPVFVDEVIRSRRGRRPERAKVRLPVPQPTSRIFSPSATPAKSMNSGESLAPAAHELLIAGGVVDAEA
jgi:hypothetical protein